MILISESEATAIVMHRKLAWIRVLFGNFKGITQLDFITNIITKQKPLNLWPVITRKKDILSVNIPVVPWEMGHVLAEQAYNSETFHTAIGTIVQEYIAQGQE